MTVKLSCRIKVRTVKVRVFPVPHHWLILDLEDTEKFHDNEGHAVDIETRGESTAKGVFFRVKEVASAFKMQHLIKALPKEDRGYEQEHHYRVYSTEIEQKKSLSPTKEC